MKESCLTYSLTTQEDVPICQRVQDLKSFIVMDVLERADEMERAGRSVVHMEIGQPDFDTPEAIIAAAIDALRGGETHYTHSLGTRKLREAVCEYYGKTYGIWNLEPDQVLITSGTSPAFLVAMSTIVEQGEEVILSDPHYPCHPNFVRFAGGKPKVVPVYEEDGFQFCTESIRSAISPKTKAILINSPANPTGSLIDSRRMAEIADMGIWVLSDEIYHGLVYQGVAHSMLEYTERCIVFNGFSKLFSMTGWRLGYLIVPKEMVFPMRKILQNLFVSANSISQAAAYTALTDESVKAAVERMRQEYDRRRQFVVRRLREIGFGISFDPIGAFYVFANARRFTPDSYRFAFEILEKAGVAITPGIDFGSNGEGYVRICYANSMESLAEGLQRIENYLSTR